MDVYRDKPAISLGFSHMKGADINSANSVHLLNGKESDLWLEFQDGLSLQHWRLHLTHASLSFDAIAHARGVCKYQSSMHTACHYLPMQISHDYNWDKLFPRFR